MGTRLHPETKDPTVLECLAGVPMGTTNQLQAIKLNSGTPLACDGPVGYLYAFESEGFGRLTEKSLQLVEQWGLDYWAGATTAPERVRQLLQAQGVTLPAGVNQSHLGGVYWA